MSASLVPNEVQLSPEVLDLAAKLGVSAELPKVVEMTCEVFPDARVEVEIDEDREVIDDVCLSVVVRNDIEDAHELFLISRQWHRRLYDCCPPNLVSAFRLNTDWRP